MKQFHTMAIIAVFVVITLILFHYKGFYTAPVVEPYDALVVPTVHPRTFSDEPSSIQTGLLLVDQLHDNNFRDGELHSLLSRVLARGYDVQVLGAQNESKAAFAEKLPKASALIVASPQSLFDSKEIAAVKSLLKRGGKVLLLADPDKESQSNVLALPLGVIFEDSYLYNLKDNDGNFRYVFFDNFARENLTDHLARITLYNACPVLPPNHGVVFTDSNTQSFTKDHVDREAPVVLKENVLAVCDQTFLTEPFAGVTDNNQFISNIADWIVS